MRTHVSRARTHVLHIDTPMHATSDVAHIVHACIVCNSNNKHIVRTHNLSWNNMTYIALTNSIWHAWAWCLLAIYSFFVLSTADWPRTPTNNSGKMKAHVAININPAFFPFSVTNLFPPNGIIPAWFPSIRRTNVPNTKSMRHMLWRLSKGSVIA